MAESRHSYPRSIDTLTLAQFVVFRRLFFNRVVYLLIPLLCVPGPLCFSLTQPRTVIRIPEYNVNNLCYWRRFVFLFNPLTPATRTAWGVSGTLWLDVCNCIFLVWMSLGARAGKASVTVNNLHTSRASRSMTLLCAGSNKSRWS